MKSCWYDFIKRFKRPFRFDPSLTKNDPDYYTAIYSSKIETFQELFDTLRGTKDAYFTASERSLLTHELLSRAHFGNDDDDDDDHREQPVAQKPGFYFLNLSSKSIIYLIFLAVNTTIGLTQGSRRPGKDNQLKIKKLFIDDECF
jgi:hypothetical protein